MPDNRRFRAFMMVAAPVLVAAARDSICHKVRRRAAIFFSGGCPRWVAVGDCGGGRARGGVARSGVIGTALVGPKRALPPALRKHGAAGLGRGVELAVRARGPVPHGPALVLSGRLDHRGRFHGGHRDDHVQGEEDPGHGRLVQGPRAPRPRPYALGAR